MKIFISHKKENTSMAKKINSFFYHKGIYTYLDNLDDALKKSDQIDDLSEYFRNEIGKCSHLLAVVSTQTVNSWWVPWEIGIATEKMAAISTYAIDKCFIPEFLKKWPYLRGIDDLTDYIEESRIQDENAQGPYNIYGSSSRVALEKMTGSARASFVRDFHTNLKRRLNQL